MNPALYFSAFILGLFSSFHCAGMCGPIALMLPQNSGSATKIFLGRFLYNTGRVTTYIVIGIIFGMIGLAATLQGFQKELSVFTGAAIIVTVLLTSGSKQRLKAYAVANSYSSPIRKNLKKLFAAKSYVSLFLIGALNGLLPCGFVYLAVAGATAAGSVGGGMLYMALFGLGTFPIMMTISVIANYFGVKFRTIYARISPYMAIALALFLIYRGTDMKTDQCHPQIKAPVANVFCPVH